MASFCTECGAKVEKDFKFCPVCGNEINNFSEKDDQKETPTVEILICSNCGEENTLNSIACFSCGVKLDKTKTASVAKSYIVQSEKRVKPKKSESKKKNRPQKNTQDQNATVAVKKLDTKKIIGFVAVSLAIVFLVLVASGMIDFSNTDVNTAPTSNIQQNQSSGIDLTAVNRINELKTIVENNPTNKDALLELANLRFDSGFFQDAAESYNQYLKLEPNNADARIDMGVCYYNLGQFDRAESEILAALKIAPDHQIGYLNLGVINLTRQNLEKAKEWFQKTVEIDPNSEIGKKAKSLLETH